MKLDKKHPLRALQKLCDAFRADLAKRGVKPRNPYQAMYDDYKRCKDPHQIKTTQDAMRRAQRPEPKTYVPKILATEDPQQIKAAQAAIRRAEKQEPKTKVPKIMITAPPPDETGIQSSSGLDESQAAAARNSKVDPSMTLQVPGARKKVASHAGKDDSSKKADAGKILSKPTPAAASSSSKTPPDKGSSSKGTKRKASNEDSIPKTPRKRFRTKSSRRPRKENSDKEYRSHWDPFISRHRCSKCNQPVDDDNHCYGGHRITPLKPRTKSGELIREMTQEEMIEEQAAGPPYRQEIYDSEDDDRFARIQEGMYTDDEEEGYQGYD